MHRAALIAAAFGLLIAACAGDASEAPADHTVDEHGVMHRAGLEAPLTNCVGCHGANLEGDKGPSCTSCHEAKW